MKKTLLSGVAFVFAFGISNAAMATEHPGNSKPGLDRYLVIAANPNPNAQCGTGAGSGAFGYIGKGYNLGIEASPGNGNIQHFPGGSWPGPGTTAQTGINNSAVCGNRPD